MKQTGKFLYHDFTKVDYASVFGALYEVSGQAHETWLVSLTLPGRRRNYLVADDDFHVYSLRRLQLPDGSDDLVDQGVSQTVPADERVLIQEVIGRFNENYRVALAQAA